MPVFDVFNLELKTQYQINDLVMINSGSSYYTRLPLNDHAALLASNNAGKTSMLSSLKLFLLPETNFKKTEKKFGFESGGKAYSDLPSFKFYFPGTDSYIILNATNPKLNFCWVLYRTTDLGYERIAVPKPYDEIEHLFWNQDSSKNMGTGELQPDISIASIKKKLTSAAFGGQIFTDKKMIGEAIYSRTSVDDDHTRFSLLPMTNKYTRSSVDIVRELLGIAFNMGTAHTGALPKAIAAIIDGLGYSAVKSNLGGVYLNMEAALEEWNDLKDVENRLANIEAHKDEWQRLKSYKLAYDEQRSALVTKFDEVSRHFKSHQANFSRTMEEAQSTAQTAEARFNQQQAAAKKAEKELTACQSDLKAHRKQKSEFEKSLELAEDTRGRLSALCPANDRSDTAIISELRNEMRMCSEEIQSLKDSNINAANMERLNKKISQTKLNRERLAYTLKELDQHATLLDSLPTQCASVLQSINSDFERLALEIGSDDKAKIESFTELFEVNSEGAQSDGRLIFCGQAMSSTTIKTWDREQTRAQLQNQIDTYDGEIRADTTQLKKLNDQSKLSSEQVKEKLKECEKELVGYNEELEALEDTSTLVRLAKKADKGIMQLSAEEAAKLKVHEVAQTELVVLRKAYNSAKEDLANLLESRATIQLIEGELKSLSSKSHGLLSLESVTFELLNDTPALNWQNTLKPHISQLSSKVDQMNGLRDKVSTQLNQLLHHGVVESEPEDQYRVITTRGQFNAYFQRLDTAYATLDQNWETFRQRLSEHNNQAQTSVRIIRQVKSLLNNFFDEINQELESYTISNLDRVVMNVTLHPQFLSLLKSLSQVETRLDALMPEEFYRQVLSFQKQFLIGDKVNIAAILTEVNYVFYRNGNSVIDPQSNGTNSMVNAVMLAILLKRMTPNDLDLSIPVIFDEVGKLDETNLGQILQVMKDHNLVLFAANPDPTGVIASVLDRMHDLSAFSVVDNDVVGVAETIYFEGMEDRLEEVEA